MADNATALRAQAVRSLEEARQHKRASSFHRRRAQEAMQQYASLEQRLAALGITFTQTEESQ